MKYLLDTNICIYLIKRNPPQVLQRFMAYTVDDIGISAITAAELNFGVQKSLYREQNHRALEQFLIPLTVVEFDYPAAAVYGETRAALESQGTPIGALDLLIAAQAISRDITLVSNNTREFARIPRLVVENWAEPA